MTMKVRRFEVWLDKNVPGCEPHTVIVEFENGESDKEIEAELIDNLNVLISNHIDSGWREIESSEQEIRK